MAVTSKDIARRLNISQSTVSRALRGDPRVSAETKARILEAARQMDYTPNLAARSLITRRTGTIGLIVSDITNPFYPELLGVLHNEFALAGYRTVLFNERTDAPLERHVADLVNGAAVDGLVYVSATLGMPLPGSGTGRIPVVLVNRYVDGDAVDTVVSDNRGGGRAVAEAMLDLGHRRVALISGPENATTSRDREQGFREGLESRGVELDDTLRRVGQFSHHSGYQWGLDLLASRARPSAIFAANDLIAFGALDAARRIGIRGPRGPLRRRLRRHRHGGLGGVQPDDGQAAPREDGTGGRRPAARADRRRRGGRTAPSPHAPRRARPAQDARARRGGLRRRRERPFDMSSRTLYAYVGIASPS